MIKIPRYFLEKAFDIREGELRRALFMQLNIFLIITTLLILKPTINALFLSAYGIKQLPVAFILVAVFAGLLTTLYAKITGWIRFKLIHMGTLVSSLLFLIFFGGALQFGLFQEWILYAFYIWLSIFALLTTSQFWLLANQVFHERELKRLVGFIGAGAIAGGIFGGYLTSVLIKYFPSEGLPFVAAFLIFLLLPLNWNIWNSIDHEVVNTGSAPVEKRKNDSPFKMILRSNHLKYLAAIVAVSVIVAKFIDYQFNAISSSIITDKDELTAFFGIWFSTFNVVSLVLQLLATRFVLNRFGVGGALIILPLLIVIISLGMLFGPEILALVIALKMADGSLKQSINRSGMELAIMPIDLNIKKKAKPFIDVFVDSVATGLSGIALITIVKNSAYEGPIISSLILVLGIVWAFLVYRMRQEYIYSFKIKINRQISSRRLSSIFSEEKVIRKSIQQALTSQNPRDIIRALQHIRMTKNKPLLPSVRKLLHHRHPEIRWEVIQTLQEYRDKKAYELVQKMTDDSDRRVQLAAFAYLIERTPQKNIDKIEQHLDSKNSRLSGLALVSLATLVRQNPKLQKKYRFEARLNQRLDQAKSESDPKSSYLGKIYSIKAISNARLKKYYPVLLSFFKDPSKNVARQAVFAAGKTKNAFFVEQFLILSNDKIVGRTAKKALIQYGPQLWKTVAKLIDRSKVLRALHLRALPDLISLNPNHPSSRKLLCRLASLRDPALRSNALKVLVQFRSQLPASFFRKKVFVNLLHAYILDYQQILSGISGIKQKKEVDLPALQLAKERLIELFQQHRIKRLEHIFILLSLRYPKEDLSTILNGLLSPQAQVKTTALEYLDILLSPRLKQLLVPVIEFSLFENSTADQKQEAVFSLPLRDRLVHLFERTDALRLQLAILNYMYVTDYSAYQDIFQRCKRHGDPEIRAFVQLFQLKQQASKVKVKSIRS